MLPRFYTGGMLMPVKIKWCSRGYAWILVKPGNKSGWLVYKDTHLLLSNANLHLFCHYWVRLCLFEPTSLIIREQRAQVKLLRKWYFGIRAKKQTRLLCKYNPLQEILTPDNSLHSHTAYTTAPKAIVTALCWKLSGMTYLIMHHFFLLRIWNLVKTSCSLNGLALN